jgi:hypothetical protein
MTEEAYPFALRLRLARMLSDSTPAEKAMAA